MLTTSTGSALCDSGDAYGRHWEKNKKKSIEDFENEPAVTVDEWNRENWEDSSDIALTVSLYHHLNESLELDDTCNAFNELPCEDWDSDVYGTSQNQIEWLTEKGFKIGDSWNSYNGESNLSQVVQGTNVTNENDISNEYILLQIHQGCDVRGGYTDAKLFKVARDYFDVNPAVLGTIDDVSVDTMYDGITLTDEGEVVPITQKSKIELYLYY